MYIKHRILQFHNVSTYFAIYKYQAWVYMRLYIGMWVHTVRLHVHICIALCMHWCHFFHFNVSSCLFSQVTKVKVHCNKTCQNGGTLDAETCVCNCTGDFSGPHCEGECVEKVLACSYWSLEIYTFCVDCTVHDICVIMLYKWQDIITKIKTLHLSFFRHFQGL